MDDALALAREGCPNGTVVAAGFQDKGRGRVPGRTWISPAGESLLATVVLRVGGMGFPLSELPLRAGVAAARAVEEAAGIRVGIKWPNDLMVDVRKCAGLLCETHGDAALVGIGVNCTQTSFPEEIARSACSLLQASGRAIPVLTLLAGFLIRLKEQIERDEWREEMLARLYRRGERVRVSLLGSGRTVEGIARDVDEQGRLVLQLSDGRLEPISQGELLTDP
jgi:BirA family biotin operon repressor/biotin-[acetyl-CoA-carboxylase] ligase